MDGEARLDELVERAVEAHVAGPCGGGVALHFSVELCRVVVAFSVFVR